MPPLKYTPDLLIKLVETFQEIELAEQELQRRKADLLSLVLGEPVLLCEKCQRPMLPRRLWELIPGEMRGKSITRVGVTQDQTLCFNHYTIKKSKEQKLDEVTVERLRRLENVQ